MEVCGDSNSDSITDILFAAAEAGVCCCNFCCKTMGFRSKLAVVASLARNIAVLRQRDGVRDFKAQIAEMLRYEGFLRAQKLQIQQLPK